MSPGRRPDWSTPRQSQHRFRRRLPRLTSQLAQCRDSDFRAPTVFSYPSSAQIAREGPRSSDISSHVLLRSAGFAYQKINLVAAGVASLSSRANSVSEDRSIAAGQWDRWTSPAALAEAPARDFRRRDLGTELSGRRSLGADDSRGASGPCQHRGRRRIGRSNRAGRTSHEPCAAIRRKAMLSLPDHAAPPRAGSRSCPSYRADRTE